MDKIEETLRNYGIEFVLATLNVILPLCTACVSALVILLSDSLCERIGKVETCPTFGKRTDRCCVFSWTICDKSCHIIRCMKSDNF
jgi:hypothetical protein